VSPRPHRLLLVAPAAHFRGGVERHVHDLAVGLVARGWELTLAAASLADPDDAYLAPFTKVVPLADLEHRANEVDAVYVHKPIDAPRLIQLAQRTPLLVAAHDHDLTCVRAHRYLPVGRVPCHRAPGLACVTHGCVLVRDREARLGLALRDPFALRAETAALGHHATFVAPSTYIASSLVAAGVPAARIRRIAPSPPVANLPLVSPPEAPHLAFLGQIITGKGLDLLLEALARLPAATLEVAGDGSGRVEAETLARRLGLAARVRFLGAIAPERTTAVLDAARIVVVPSRWPEPFGMVGVEAMRRGRLVVAARHGGIPEWLHEGAAGYGFLPGDVADLTRVLHLALASPPAVARARAEAGGVFAASRFSFDGLLDGVEQAVRDTCAASGHRAGDTFQPGASGPSGR
jgi:glycosyltransferase involved in cell wall biosynthesis